MTVASSTTDTNVVGTTTVGFDDLGEAIFEDIALSKAGSAVDLTFTITKAYFCRYYFQEDLGNFYANILVLLNPY